MQWGGGQLGGVEGSETAVLSMRGTVAAADINLSGSRDIIEGAGGGVGGVTSVLPLL